MKLLAVRSSEEAEEEGKEEKRQEEGEEKRRGRSRQAGSYCFVAQRSFP